MGLIAFILGLVVSGAIVGGLARLALPGPDPMSIGQTILVGIGGSFLAGIITGLLFGRPAGIIFSVLGATAIVALIRRSRAGSGSGPSPGY
jgi:uncharacterized membrane protein YeaQ/YmgE (transglycosylase-associated protein family)